MHDVRSLAPEKGHQLEYAERVTPKAERTADVLELDEARAGRPRCSRERAVAVGSHSDVEWPGDCRKQGSDVRLRSSGFGERDEKEDPWTPRRTARS